MKYEARFFEGGYSSAETPEIANLREELEAAKAAAARGAQA